MALPEETVSWRAGTNVKVAMAERLALEMDYANAMERANVHATATRGTPRQSTSLRRRLARRRMRGDEVIDRRLHAALLVRDARERQRHLRDAQRADKHAVVDVAEMADAEILAGVAAEARAIGNVEGVEREVAEGVGVVAVRHHHRGDRRRMISRLLAQDLQPPGAHRAACRLGQAMVAC